MLVNGKEIDIGQTLYYNTTGAYGKNISQKCYILDIGEIYVWLMMYGNLSPTPIKDVDKLSEKPKYKVTNENFKLNL